MRIALIRECLISKKLANNNDHWRSAWELAKDQLKNDKLFKIVSSTLNILFISFIILIIMGLLVISKGTIFLTASAVILIIGLTIANFKISIIDDLACKIIQNGLTSR